MSAQATAGAGLTLRLALRELRGGLRGFHVFIACIALGVLAIAAVESFAESLADGLARQGRVIIGGDEAFSLIQREASPAERAFLAARGDVSAVATLRAMTRTADGRLALVEAKAVDAAYPLYGTVVAGGDGDATPLASLLARRGDAFGAVVDPALLTRLDLKPGARVTLGAAIIELRAALKSEPDKLAGGIGFGPRLLISEDALRASGLLQPGSLVRWTYRLRLPAGASSDADAQAVVDAANKEMPEAGWEIRSRGNATPQLERNIERVLPISHPGRPHRASGRRRRRRQFRRHYLDRKRSVIATMKSLGATGTRVVAVYFVEVLLLAGSASPSGLAFGAVLPFAVASIFGHHSAAAGAALSGPARPGAGLWRADGDDLCAVAARARPRPAGFGAVSRRDRASGGCRGRATWWRRRWLRQHSRRSRSPPPMTARSRRSSSPARSWCLACCA
jgi:putative ABC transport system permease protein